MNRRQLWRIVVWIAPILAVVVVLAVLRGAGVPFTIPGVIVVLVLLLVARIVVGRGRRRAARRAGRR
ncbi:MAG: hypothetical protein PIR02_02135 [Microbacterium enclense]